MPLPFRLDLRDPAAPILEVGGVDLSPYGVRRVAFDAEPGQQPTVQVELTVEPEVDGVGDVVLVLPDPDAQARILVDWIDRIDPEALGSGVIERLNLDPMLPVSQATVAALRALALEDT